jgi:XTP/dITP diphosphohydrolase/ATP diphosphatase
MSEKREVEALKTGANGESQRIVSADVDTGPARRAAAPLAEAISIMARLRAPDGCPWDREQSFDSIKRHTLEETYEVFDAIERRAWPDLKDELGDLLLQILFYAQMANEAGYFDIADVATNLNAKLIRRHPHVFAVDGELAEARDSDSVLRNWEQIKLLERKMNEADYISSTSALDTIAHSMPAVMEAGKLGSKAAKVGFDWPNCEGLFEKLQEEIGELKVEIVKRNAATQAGLDSPQEGLNPPPNLVEEELGDLLFTAINLARHLKVDAESALRGANAKFRRRFGYMEADAGGFEALARLAPEQLEALWKRAKCAGRDAADGRES